MDEMDQIMDRLHLEDTVFNNDHLSVEESARQIINIIGWKK
jgi:hypothetical protein